MFTDNKVWMAQSDKRLFLLPSMGIIAGLLILMHRTEGRKSHA